MADKEGRQEKQAKAPPREPDAAQPEEGKPEPRQAKAGRPKQEQKARISQGEPAKPQAKPPEKRPQPPAEPKGEARPSAGKPPEGKGAPDKTEASPMEAKPREDPGKPAHAKADKAAEVCHDVNLLLFNRWDTSGVKVRDPGLRAHINLTCMAVPRTGGKYGPGHITRNRMSLVERFMNKLMVAGHRGKKHKISSGKNVGKTPMLYRTMKEAFTLMERQAKRNPLEVMVGAVENSALLEEVASYRLGGIIARNAVITAPQRRLDMALRHLTQGIYRASFRSRQSLAQVIVTELVAAYNNDPKSFAVSERRRLEREAEGAR